MILSGLKGIRELRFVLSQTDPASDVLRNYIAKNYKTIRESPTKITVRECQSAKPMLIATLSYGVQRQIALTYSTQLQIQKMLAMLEDMSESRAKTIQI